MGDEQLRIITGETGIQKRASRIQDTALTQIQSVHNRFTQLIESHTSAAPSEAEGLLHDLLLADVQVGSLCVVLSDQVCKSGGVPLSIPVFGEGTKPELAGRWDVVQEQLQWLKQKAFPPGSLLAGLLSDSPKTTQARLSRMERITNYKDGLTTLIERVVDTLHIDGEAGLPLNFAFDPSRWDPQYVDTAAHRLATYCFHNGYTELGSMFIEQGIAYYEQRVQKRMNSGEALGKIMLLRQIHDQLRNHAPAAVEPQATQSTGDQTPVAEETWNPLEWGPAQPDMIEPRSFIPQKTYILFEVSSLQFGAREGITAQDLGNVEQNRVFAASARKAITRPRIR